MIVSPTLQSTNPDHGRNAAHHIIFVASRPNSAFPFLYTINYILIMIPHCEISSSSLEKMDVAKPLMLQEPRKSVRFHPDTTVCLIPSRDDYTEFERNLVWHNQEEYQIFMEECIEVIGRMNRGIPEHEYLSYRGLEWKLKSSSKKRRQLRRQAQVAILEEQDQQWHSQNWTTTSHADACPLKIAAAYQPYSMTCQQDAHQLGCQDAAAARAIYADGTAGGLPLPVTSTRTEETKRLLPTLMVTKPSSLSKMSSMYINERIGAR